MLKDTTDGSSLYALERRDFASIISILYRARYLDLFQPKRTVQYQGLTYTVIDYTDFFFCVQAKDGAKPASTQPCRNHYLLRGYAIASPNGFITFSTRLPFGIAIKEMDGKTLEELYEGICPHLELPPFMQNVPSRLDCDICTLNAQEIFQVKFFKPLLLDSVTEVIPALSLHFHFLKCVYPQKMEAQVDQTWVICCYLACLLHDPMGLSEKQSQNAYF
ncbi:LOW QUALITY PROTEIN: uncharacterized protein RB166_020619 [Leptodactylus fuscus]